jgi:hypothetical protein
MKSYCTPTLIKERLNNGEKIPLIFYELNPLRSPFNRINHYKNIFEDKKNKTLTDFRKIKKIKKSRNIKTKSAKNNLLLLRINYERPREIINNDGIIISRHFKSLYINSREYPKNGIKSFAFKKNIDSNNKKYYNGNFFSTEIKFNNNKNYIDTGKNFGKRIDEIKKENNNIIVSKAIFNQTNFIEQKIKNKTSNIQNRKNHKSFASQNNHKIPPLLFKSY